MQHVLFREMVTIIHTASKVSVFGVFLVCIFPQSVLSRNSGKYGQENSEYGQFSRCDTFFFSFSTSKTVLQLFPTKKCYLIKFLLLNSKKAYFLIFRISKAWKPFLHLNHFMPLVSFPHGNIRKALAILWSQGGIEIDRWHEMG